jgi:hypothetical protein
LNFKAPFRVGQHGLVCADLGIEKLLCFSRVAALVSEPDSTKATEMFPRYASLSWIRVAIGIENRLSGARRQTLISVNLQFTVSIGRLTRPARVGS